MPHSNVAEIEAKTIEVYNDIHPFVDVEYTIDYYLKTIQKDISFFKNKNILDCGFGGTGWSVELFCRADAKSVTGIELNPNSVKTIRERLKKYPCPQDLRIGNVLSLPFENETFDYVHSHGVMHHTVDWKKGVSEMARTLKPGGSMYLGMYATFGPIGKAIYSILRGIATFIPYRWASNLVLKTGFLRHSEFSILDLMYVPVEEHVTDKEVRELLQSLGMTNIQNRPNRKWQNHWLTHPLLFGKHIHHAFVCEKIN